MTAMAAGRGDDATIDVPIRDATCLLVADISGSEPKLLMGKRHADQVFLPNKWVFPGGRVEEEDRQFADRFAEPFSPNDLARAIKPFALAGIRELYEETGLLIGSANALPDPGPVWQTFAASGQAPAPKHLIPLARAITPPGRVRRYDTWFFLANANALSAPPAATDGELLDIGWFTLPKAGKLDLPNITRLVLDDVASVFRATRDFGDTVEPLPFYYSDGSTFRRDLISCKVAPPTP
ncbi:NUDIX hydrolase [Hyphomicrobium sp.]|jgi:8-oxo-dGTP pyrophosphatase MutT (NUDIX family)|uniref:NUDIX hydrolase n=1 Tax=Hyphomicrobium sp. TaxID=82 RepID=UPI00356A4B50